MPCNTTWESNNGWIGEVHDMDDRHLRNAYAQLLAALSEMPAPEELGWPNFRGEMAQEIAEKECERYWDGHDGMVHRCEALKTEMERRGLARHLPVSATQREKHGAGVP